jgi:5-methylcytosine-specific restriction protein A
MPSRPPTRKPQQWKSDTERRAAYDRQRPSSTERGYDAPWRKLRVVFLRAHPICCVAGCNEVATDVDHILSVRDRPDLRLEWSNARQMCHGHHSSRTARDQRFAQKRKRD